MMWSDLVYLLEELKGGRWSKYVIHTAVGSFLTRHRPEDVSHPLDHALGLQSLVSFDVIQGRLRVPDINEELQGWILDIFERDIVLTQPLHRIFICYFSVLV